MSDESGRRPDLLLRGATIITIDERRRVYNNGYMAVKDGIIESIGSDRECPYQDASQTIEGAGTIVMPGIVNAHDHLAQSLFRGTLDEMGPSSARRGGLFYHSQALTAERAEAAALLTLLELTRYGVTTTHDSHFTHAHKDSIDGVCRAIQRSGLRAIVARAANDVDVIPEVYLESVGEALSELERVRREWQSERLHVIPEAVGTLRNTPEMIQAMYEDAVAQDTIWHMHLAQNFAEREATVEKYGCGAVELLDRLGVLDERLLAAHVVGVAPEEIPLLGQAGVAIAHCPLANLYRGSTIAPIMDFMDHGLTVAIGVDGAGTNNGQNPWEMAKIAIYLQKHLAGDYQIGSAEMGLEMLTIDAAVALGVADRVGSLEPGKDADFICIDAFDPSLMPSETLPSHLIYAMDPRAIRRVYSRGELLWSDENHQTLDQEQVYDDATRARDEMLEELGNPEPRRTCWQIIA